MNRRVFILGAGASASPEFGDEGSSIPVMSDFFSFASQLKLRHDYTALWRLAERLGINEEARLCGDVTLEQLFIVLDVLSGRLWDPLPTREALAEFSARELEELGAFDFWSTTPRELMVSFIADVLSQASAPLVATACQLHDRFVEGLSNGDAIISLNYDLLIDKSLMVSGRWSPADGYGTSAFVVGGHYATEYPELDHRGVQLVVPKPTVDGSDVLLLKPHGSLNWWHWTVASNATRLPVPGPMTKGMCALLSIGDAIDTDLDPGPGRLPSIEEVWSGSPHTQRETLLSLRDGYEGRNRGRYIVPPIGFKTALHTTPPWIRDVWASAFQALIQADEIVLIGYSVPETDYTVRLLLADPRARSRKTPRLTIVDPKGPNAVLANLRSGATPYRVPDDLVVELEGTFADYVRTQM